MQLNTLTHMKKYTKLLGLLTIVIVLAGCLAGCNFILGKLGLGGTFSLENTTVSLKIGEVYEVTLSANSAKEGFKLSSADSAKVEVVGDNRLKGVDKTTSAVAVTATSDSGKTSTISVSVDYAELGELTLTTADETVQLIGDDEEISPILFMAIMSGGIDPNTLVSWKVTEKGDDTIITTHTGSPSDSTFSFTPVQRMTMYTVSVSAGNMHDSIDCGVFKSVYISAAKEKYKLNEEIKLAVTVRTPENFTGSNATFDIYVDDEVKYGNVSATLNGSGEIRTTTLSLGSFNSVTDFNVSVDYNGDRSNTLPVKVSELVAADHIQVTTEESLLQQRGTAQTVNFNAVLAPTTANAESIEWYVNGTKKGSGAAFSYHPQAGLYGEYHIKAVVDKLSSETFTIVYLPSTDTRWNYASFLTAYGGSKQNRYITSQEELNAVVVYALENQKFGSPQNTLDLYIDYSYSGSMSDAIDVARLTSTESGIIAGYAPTVEADGKQLHIAFNYSLGGVKINNSPTTDPTGSDNTQQNTISKPHYTTGAYTRNFYIDRAENTRTMSVSTSNLLYKAVAWGYKPVFTGTADNINKLQQIYDNAKSVLATIVTDDMTEYEKVHAIYDWIIYNVRYDYDLAGNGGASDNATLNENMRYYGYYLEGIFLDTFFNAGKSHAVCDGKSKAFVLMCGIEGVNALRIAGKVADGGGHAWNKVLLDPDEDGVKNWFVIDTTWGDKAVAVQNAPTTEYLTHGYFMVNDATIYGTHIEDRNRNYPVADGVYDYYAKTTFTYLGYIENFNVQNSIVVTPYTKLSRIFKWAKSKNYKYVEFKYEGTLTQNMLSSAANNAGVQLKYSEPIEIRSGVYGVVLVY